MYEKRCSRCEKYSYSSDPHHEWICPYCNHNISHLNARVPKHLRLIVTEKEIKEMRKSYLNSSWSRRAPHPL